MSVWARVAAAMALAIGVTACSPGHHANFETKGLIAPPSQCWVKPSQIGLAEQVATIDEGNGCEVPNPWKVYSLQNVHFSQPSVMNCGLANPVGDWLANTVQPAAQQAFGEQVTSIEVIDTYSCRPRNNRRGAKMSEHGFGNAIDVGAFVLASGRRVTVLDGWNGSTDEQGFLRLVRAQACNNFMTVLGPGSDWQHRNHIHLDLEVRTSGIHYCH
jgi:hypothetical protein